MRSSFLFLFIATALAQEGGKTCTTEQDLFRAIAALPEVRARKAIDDCRLAFSWSDAFERKLEGALLASPYLEDEAARTRVREYVRAKLPAAPAPAQFPPQVSSQNPRERTRDKRVEMFIPPGSFQRGCAGPPLDPKCEPDELPVKMIEITKGFWIGQTEVTQDDYDRFMKAKKHVNQFKGGDLPVDSINWNDARAFCKVIGMDLPTEAQWEYAARAGSKNAAYGASLPAIAWFSENSEQRTRIVGTRLPNAFGLFDMLGNVWEWVLDWYNDRSYDLPETRNPVGWRTGEKKVLRGGSWGSDIQFVRASYRSRYEPTLRDYSIGFRCAGE